MANRKYISLGMQCTTSAILDKLNIRKESYPFDWALTHLKFIFLFIKELYETDSTQLHSKITKINVPSFANGGDMANWCGDNLQLNI